ncbi:MAG: ABC transporter permease [Bacteroidales bacterium]|nr:ABC transporter permease [Bacteroidales bacterium]
MIRSYFIIAARNFRKNITFSLINLLGLSIAFALFILLSLYIFSELSTDNHIKNIGNIYCLYEKNDTHIFTCGLFADYIYGRYPEVKQVCRSFIWDGTFFLEDGHFIHFNNFGYVDSNYFKMFDSKVILGNLENALDGNNGMVLTESSAKALFNDKNPIGETVSLEGEYDFVVNAVIPDLPENSSHRVQCYVSIQSLLTLSNALLTNPGNWSVSTFVEIKENSNIPSLEEKLSKDLLEEFKRNTNWGLLAYADIYFNTSISGPDEIRRGNKQFIMLFIGIALFILVIACINYINLTTARAGSRAREVGIRKVVGAYKQKLIKQFLIESVMLIFISLIMGFLLAELSIGEFNRLAETNLQVKAFYAFPFNIFFIVGAVLLGVVSGIYPAFVLTSFKTVEVIKGRIAKSSEGIFARKVLMVFQFILSLTMIVGSIVIYRQINYVKQVNLGFDKENVIRMKIKDEVDKSAQSFKDELLTIPGIEKISFCYGMPGDVGSGMYEVVNGQEIDMRHLQCDHEFVDLFGLQVVSGRNFSGEDGADIGTTYMINEAAVKKFGWENPYEIKIWGFKLIGIVKDFNFQSMHQEVGPLFITYFSNMSQILIRISGANKTEVLDKIEKAWINMYPEDPFSFEFVDQVIDQQYKAEERLGKVVSYFSVFALVIAFMGLLGMTSFMILQRRREIGIRKVHGGDVSQIVNMLSFEFVKWVIFAFIISVPISYYLMKTWLDKNFTSQVELEWWIFAISGFLVIIISLLTVSIQAYRAAMMNPVDSLRYE